MAAFLQPSDEPTVTPDEPTVKSKKRVEFNESEIESQKKCIPGPNVLFPADKNRISSYVDNFDQIGKLGCPHNMYPKYTNGKYCCSDTAVTHQEILDYINIQIENIYNNMTLDKFNESEIVNILIYNRRFIMNRYKKYRQPITDNLDPDYLDAVNNFIERERHGGAKRIKQQSKKRTKKSKKKKNSSKRRQHPH